MTEGFKVGDRVVAEKGYFGDRYVGKTGKVINNCSDPTGAFSACVEFDEQIGFRGVGKLYGGRDGYCVYGDSECLRSIPDEPSAKIKFDELF